MGFLGGSQCSPYLGLLQPPPLRGTPFKGGKDRQWQSLRSNGGGLGVFAPF